MDKSLAPTGAVDAVNKDVEQPKTLNKITNSIADGQTDNTEIGKGNKIITGGNGNYQGYQGNNQWSTGVVKSIKTTDKNLL